MLWVAVTKSGTQCSWHCPELVKIVSDNYTYATLVKYVKHKTSLTSEMLEEISKGTGDER